MPYLVAPLEYKITAAPHDDLSRDAFHSSVFLGSKLDCDPGDGKQMCVLHLFGDTKVDLSASKERCIRDLPTDSCLVLLETKGGTLSLGTYMTDTDVNHNLICDMIFQHTYIRISSERKIIDDATGELVGTVTSTVDLPTKALMMYVLSGKDLKSSWSDEPHSPVGKGMTFIRPEDFDKRNSGLSS